MFQVRSLLSASRTLCKLFVRIRTAEHLLA
uniref:Uncharacterized protein n=1 Tax=Anguilla anguilla TaxID=7936 RepID=A0A0E9TG90_ANGAN